MSLLLHVESRCNGNYFTEVTDYPWQLQLHVLYINTIVAKYTVIPTKLLSVVSTILLKSFNFTIS